MDEVGGLVTVEMSEPELDRVSVDEVIKLELESDVTDCVGPDVEL